MAYTYVRKWLATVAASISIVAVVSFLLLKMYLTDTTTMTIRQNTGNNDFQELAAKLAHTEDLLIVINMNFEHTLNSALKAMMLMYGSDYYIDRSRKISAGRRDAAVLTLEGSIINNNRAFITQLSEIFKIDVSMLVREGTDFIRVASSVTNSAGNSVVGTQLGTKHVAHKFVTAGKCYIGRTNIFGKDYYAKYEPIIIDGKVEGILVVGVSYEKFRAQLSSILWGS